MAATIVKVGTATEGVMISYTALRKRKKTFSVGNWIMDSSAFYEICKYGHHRDSVETYSYNISRWAANGNMQAAVVQDWVCEPLAIKQSGLNVKAHQKLSRASWDALVSLRGLDSSPPIMPVIQGFRVHEFVEDIAAYGDSIPKGWWVGVGSLCKKNAKPDEVVEILRAIHAVRPDIKMHGFGIKVLALANRDVGELLYSSDSRAWSYPTRFMSTEERKAVNYLDLAHNYQDKVVACLNGTYKKQNQTPPGAGPNNGQGRKSKWRHGPTKAIRVPEVFAQKLIEVAKLWDTPAGKLKPPFPVPVEWHDSESPDDFR